MAGIPAKTLLNIAKDIGGSNPKVLDLGLLLKFSYTETSQYIATNNGGAGVTSHGTKQMLFQWKEKTPNKDQVRILKQELVEAELVNIAENRLPTGPHSDADVLTSRSTYEIAAAAIDSLGLVSQKPSSGIGASPDTTICLTHNQGFHVMVTEDELNKLSEGFPPHKYHNFCHILSGMDYNQAGAILSCFNNDFQRATRQVLADWKTRTGGWRADLHDALEKAGARRIAVQMREGRGAAC